MEFVERGSYREVRMPGLLRPLISCPFIYSSVNDLGNSVTSVAPTPLEGDEVHRNTLLFREIGDGRNRISLNGALEQVGTGRFQYTLTLICGLVSMSSSVSAGILGILLPAAKCSLDISANERGLIISSGLLGMVMGTFLWGVVADTRGRRAAILLSLATDSFASLATALSFDKRVLLFVRFFNGLGSVGAGSLIFSYGNDFIIRKYRDCFLAALEVFFGIGTAYIPLMAMHIIPKKVSVKIGFISLQSWNFFVLACTILPMISLILLFFLPENPVFLISQKRSTAALGVIHKMYNFNHGPNKKLYLVEDQPESEKTKRIFLDHLKKMASQRTEMFGAKYLSKTIKICTISMLVNFSFLTVSIWIPTLLDRHDYEKQIGGKEETFCDAAVHVGKTLEKMVPCNNDISPDVYFKAMLIGLFSIPFTVSIFIALRFFGRNELIILLTVIAGMSCVFLNIVAERLKIVICCILFQSTANLTVTLIMLSVVNMYPAYLSSTAVALTATFGKASAVVGNTMFGALINQQCYFPMYLFAATFFAAFLIELTLPRIGAWK